MNHSMMPSITVHMMCVIGGLPAAAPVSGPTVIIRGAHHVDGRSVYV